MTRVRYLYVIEAFKTCRIIIPCRNKSYAIIIQVKTVCRQLQFVVSCKLCSNSIAKAENNLYAFIVQCTVYLMYMQLNETFKSLIALRINYETIFIKWPKIFESFLILKISITCFSSVSTWIYMRQQFVYRSALCSLKDCPTSHASI